MRSRPSVLAVLALGVALVGPLAARAQPGALLGKPAPELASGPWINSPPLTMAGLRGRVVFLEFWTYG